MNYIYPELRKIKKDMSWWESWVMFFEYYKYKFFFRCFSIYSYLSFKDIKEEKLNAEEVFEYKH
jgi:hypothetical protein